MCAFNTKDQEGSRFSKHNKEVLLWTGPESPLRKGHSHSRAIQVCAAGWGRFSWHVFFLHLKSGMAHSIQSLNVWNGLYSLCQTC